MPVKNLACGHMYDKASIERGHTGQREDLHCIVVGCPVRRSVWSDQAPGDQESHREEEVSIERR